MKYPSGASRTRDIPVRLIQLQPDAINQLDDRGVSSCWELTFEEFVERGLCIAIHKSRCGDGGREMGKGFKRVLVVDHPSTVDSWDRVNKLLDF